MISGKRMNSKKILLVSANRHADPYPVYPLGISYLSSFLRSARPGSEVILFDFMTGSFEEYSMLIRESRPDYIGISLRNIDDVNIYKKESFIAFYKKVIAFTRSNCKSIIVVGGSGFSIYPVHLFEILKPDFGIYGEGELSLLGLMDTIETNGDLSSVGGLVYYRGDKITVNTRNSHFRTPLLSFDGTLTDYYWHHSGMLNIQTKRGCPYNCIYCTYPIIEGHNVRTLDPGQIVTTLKDLKSEKGIDYVFFTDSIFNISNGFNYELADRLIEAELNMRWGGYFNFTNIDRKLLEKMKEAGLTHIEFGTDSLSDEVLEKCGKPFRVEEIMKICAYCTELEIDHAHFLILGGYGETEGTLDETFRNSGRLERTVFFPFIGMRIYPGTRLHEIAIAEKIVNKSDVLLEPVYYVSKDVVIDTLKARAKATGKAWIFPDDDLGNVMTRFRERNKKGPLWEYLIK